MKVGLQKSFKWQEHKRRNKKMDRAMTQNILMASLPKENRKLGM